MKLCRWCVRKSYLNDSNSVTQKNVAFIRIVVDQRYIDLLENKKTWTPSDTLIPWFIWKSNTWISYKLTRKVDISKNNKDIVITLNIHLIAKRYFVHQLGRPLGDSKLPSVIGLKQIAHPPATVQAISMCGVLHVNSPRLSAVLMVILMSCWRYAGSIRKL